jgi:hypothetical protein
MRTRAIALTHTYLSPLVLKPLGKLITALTSAHRALQKTPQGNGANPC